MIILKILKTLLGWIMGERGYLTLLLVAGAAASLYAWGAAGRADRARLIAWGDKVCSSAGAELQPVKGSRGAACADRIVELANEERDTLKVSNAALAAAHDRDQARSLADLAAARVAMNKAADAARNMGKANDAIGTNDQVGGDWFGALNRVGGLREPH